MSAHYFGPPVDLMGRGERLCNEPKFGKAEDVTVYHANFTLLAKGDMVCNHCGEHFNELKEA